MPAPTGNWRRAGVHHFQRYVLPADTTPEGTAAIIGGEGTTPEAALAKLSGMMPTELRVRGGGAGEAEGARARARVTVGWGAVGFPPLDKNKTTHPPTPHRACFASSTAPGK